MDLRECKRCLVYEMADKAAYKSVYDYIEAMDENLKTDSDTYLRRLDCCRECDNLLSGMCRVCGCFVEIRAIRKNSACPHINKKW